MPGFSLQLCLTALFTALGVLFPILFHAVGLGSVFLPMFWPVAASGFFLPPASSLAVAVLAPVLSFLLTGMPPVSPPVLHAIVPEMAVLVSCVRILSRRFRLHPILALAVGLVLSRMVLFLGARCLGPVIGLPPSFASAAAILHGLPGVAAMLVCIPIVVARLNPAVMHHTTASRGKTDPRRGRQRHRT